LGDGGLECQQRRRHHPFHDDGSAGLLPGHAELALDLCRRRFGRGHSDRRQRRRPARRRERDRPPCQPFRPRAGRGRRGNPGLRSAEPEPSPCSCGPSGPPWRASGSRARWPIPT
jgi:hypothetical protein